MREAATTVAESHDRESWSLRVGGTSHGEAGTWLLAAILLLTPILAVHLPLTRLPGGDRATLSPSRATAMGSGTGWCPNGTILSQTNGSITLTACLTETVLYTMTTVQVALNVTGGTGPFYFQWYWGDGYLSSTNGTTPSRSTGFWTFNYTISGTYGATFSVRDSKGLVAFVSHTYSVVAPGGPLFVSLAATNVASSGGSPGTTTVSWWIMGGSGPYSLRLDFGDGNAGYVATNSSVLNPFGFVNHTYGSVSVPTTYSVSAYAVDGAGTNASASILVSPTYNLASNCSGPSIGSTGACAYWTSPTNLVMVAWNHSLTLRANGTLMPPTATTQDLNLTIVESDRNNTASRMLVVLDPGIGNGSFPFNATGSNLTVHWVQAYAQNGSYALSLTGYFLWTAGPPQPQGNVYVGASIPIALAWNGSGSNNSSHGNGSGHSGPHTAYPATVNVTVAANPVTGTTPLYVGYAAYVSGGAAPFQVVWSLPGGTGPSNATGLAANDTYAQPGWYTATALVYNTTSAYGTVLVGVGSVWVDVLGANGSNGSGNGSNASRGLPHNPSGSFTAGGQGAPMTFDTLLIAISIGGLAGAIVGVRLGRSTMPIGRSDRPAGVRSNRGPFDPPGPQR